MYNIIKYNNVAAWSGIFVLYLFLLFFKERPQEMALQFTLCDITKVLWRLSEFGALSWFDQPDFVIPCLVQLSNVLSPWFCHWLLRKKISKKYKAC